jgi:deoxycytidine triphosphate deaminase
MLNAQQILDEGLLKLDHTHGKPAQVGFDLTLKQVNKIGNIGVMGDKIGKVLKDKTELTNYTPYALMNLDGVSGWLLYQGVYDITFNEGCKLPENRVAFIKQRSSLYRN